MINRTVTAVLDAPSADVFDFLSRVENLPSWATDFARELKYENGKPKVVNGLGEFYFRIDAHGDTGVIDMFAGPDESKMAIFLASPGRGCGIKEKHNAATTHWQRPARAGA